MNLVSIAKRRAPLVKSGWGGSFGSATLGQGYTDINRKDRAPSPYELIGQLVGTTFACANLNANAVASNPLRLFVRTSKGQRRTRWATEPLGRKTIAHLCRTKQVGDGFLKSGGTVEEVKDHPILNVLDIGDGLAGAEDEDDEGQPRLLGHHLFWGTQIYLETLGHAYWLIERDGLGVVGKTWLLRSHLVREIPDYDRRDGKIISYYEYGGANGVRYDPKDIIRFANPDPNLLYLGGMSPTQAAIEKIRLLRRDDAMLSAVLQNMGYPGAILSPKGTDGMGGMIGPDVARRIRVAWDQMLREAGAGGTITLPESMDVTFPQWKPAEIVPLDKAKAIKTDIANCFDIPDTLLERNFANLASAKTGELAHAKYGVMPRCNNVQATLKRLVRMFDDSGRLFLAYDNPIPDDEVFELDQMKAASAGAAIEVDEFRTAVGLEPYGDEAGKMRYAPKGTVAIGRDGLPVGGDPEPDVTDNADDPANPPGKPPKKPAKDDGKKTVRAVLMDAGYADEEAAEILVKHATKTDEHAEL